MTSVGGLIRAGTQAAALVALLLAATPLAAQTVNEYRLPGTVTTQPTGSAPGPVDSDAPAVRVPPAQPDERPAATESSAASSAPVAVRPTPAPAATPRREAAPRPSPTGREVQPQPTPPASLPSPAPSTAPTTAPAALPSALPSAAPAPVPVTVPAEPASQEAPMWPWIAVIAALAYAESLAQGSPASFAMIKRQLRDADGQDFETARAASMALTRETLDGPDFKEAMAALRGKRAARMAGLSVPFAPPVSSG